MRYLTWAFVLVAAFAPAVAWADEPGDEDIKAKAVEDMRQREMELDIESRKDELQHQRQCRELELEKRQLEVEQWRREVNGDQGHHEGGGLVLWAIVANILLTIWVYKDMHEQKIGRALWVPIVLLTGAFGAILYAIVRMADMRNRPPEAQAKAK